MVLQIFLKNSKKIDKRILLLIIKDEKLELEVKVKVKVDLRKFFKS